MANKAGPIELLDLQRLGLQVEETQAGVLSILIKQEDALRLLSEIANSKQKAQIKETPSF